MVKSEMFLLGSISLALVGTYIEIVYEKEVEASGAEVIWYLQSVKNQPVVWMFIGLDVVTGGGFVAAALVIYWCGDRFIGALATFLGVFGATLASLLKMCFLHPRPLYSFEFLEAFSCSKDSGFPSGHSLSSGCVCFILMVCLQKPTNLSVYKNLIIILSLALVAIDRLYLAAHFYFQITMGFVYASVVVSFVSQGAVMNWIKKSFSLRGCQAGLHLGGILFWGACLMVYFLRDGSLETEWKTNYVNKCGTELRYEDFIYKNIHECTAIGFLMGFPLGYSFTSKLNTIGFSRESVGFSVFLGAVVGAVYVILEILFKFFFGYTIRLILSFACRYLIGFCVSYAIPVIVDTYIHKSGILSLESTDQIELNKHKS